MFLLKVCCQCACFFLFVELLYGQSKYRMFPTQTEAPISLMASRQTHVQFLQQQKGSRSYVRLSRDGQTLIDGLDLRKVLNVIVEFKELPFFIQRTTARQAIAPTSFFAAHFLEFTKDIQKIHLSNQNQLQIQLTTPQIDHEFYKVFFGVSLRVPRIALQQIQRLNYVKKIHLNTKVEAHLDESVPLIRADSVWHKYGTEGDSVVVGILDTGIDYRHPALGGGFGSGFKVIGGYDVINRDADPLDDNGHGTFVAGIVAANGDSIRGVAPKALLMGIKVLDKNGFGQESQIIAGIERALDPNDDNDLSDKVDIANMSLGSREAGNPDDALSIAVDNATKLGITFCVAAGNQYRFKTIGSPGSARLAITVGATDKNDHIAPFTSKGPNRKIYSIKPEIVAPGVDIRSLALQNGFVKASGTSAAAPHVTGVCALLKAVHADWTPAQIKSAIITSAIDLGEEVMVQGAGRLDALNAVAMKAFAMPAHLSFGLADASSSEWTKLDTVIVVNQAEAEQSFDIAFAGTKNGIQMLTTPSSFTLAKGDSQSVIVTLKVNHDLVPYPVEGSLAFEGQMYVTGTTDKLRLPWAFVKAARVTLTFDEPLPFFAFSSNKTVITEREAERIDPYTFEIVTAKGLYDVVTLFLGGAEKVVVKENLVFEGDLNLTVSTQEARHLVELKSVDERGRLLATMPNTRNHYNHFVFYFPDSSRSYLWALFGAPNQLFVSEVSERFVLGAAEYQDDLATEASMRYVSHKPILGLKQSLSLSNAPSDLIEQRLRFKYPSKGNYRDINLGGSFSAILPTASFFFSSGFIIKPYRVRSQEWVGTLYQTPDYYFDKYRFAFTAGATARDVELNGETLIEDWVATMPFRVVGDSLGSFFPSPTAASYLSPNGGEMSFGGAPIYGVVWLLNNRFETGNIAGTIQFHGALDEYRWADIFRSQYAIYDESDHTVASGDLIKYTFLNIPPAKVPPGRYRLEVRHSNYFVEGVQGTATLSTRFDLRQRDPDPPHLTSLKLFDAKGIPAGRIETGESAKLSFSAADIFAAQYDGLCCPVYRPIAADSTKLYFKQYGTSLWQEIPIKQVLEDTSLGHPDAIGYLYTADLSHTTNFDSAAIDLKISVQDQSGNRTEWRLEPAYAVGKFGTVVSVEEEPQESPALPRAYKLYPSHPNPFSRNGGGNVVIHFDLPHTKKVTMKIYDVLGREVATLIDKIVEAGRHQIIWSGVSHSAQPLASGVYICKIQTAHFEASTKLLLLR